MRGRLVLGLVLALCVGLGASPSAAPVTFDAHAPGRLVLSGSTYRLVLAKRNGKILGLVDRTANVQLLGSAQRCLWGVLSASDLSYVGGCSFPAVAYRWRAGTSTLTLTYRGRIGSVVVTVHALPTYFDLRLTFVDRSALRTRVRFPDGLNGDTRTVAGGYAPNVLPGVHLKPSFFSGNVNTAQIYPSRWAFADYLAFDAGHGHAALYSVSAGALHPVELGFVHQPAPSSCSGTSFCLFHEFETWIRPGTTWTSPVVRVRIGETAQRSILAYRSDNGIASYPSLASKLGPLLPTLARAPLLKANLPLLKPFAQWAADLQKLPAPLLIHPVAYTPGGHDSSDPDFLPPDPRWGSNADFAAMVAAAHARGDLVMPYLNFSWWDPTSPTMQHLPAPLQPKDVAVLDAHGNPVTISYGTHTGVIVSPFVQFVRQRFTQGLDQWRTDVPADCVFLDQVGARPWLYDFNPASPDPTSYDDGWLALLHPYAGRCLMVEDGWDRLARDAVGFHGGLLMMERELGLPDQLYGAGNWEPYPLADWLFHDKVLMYQHDLFDGTMVNDATVLVWNLAFGLVSSFSWDKAPNDTSPWLELAAALQRDLGPHYAGVPLDSYATVAPDVTESTFGDLDVVANWNATNVYSTDAGTVAPRGFLARTSGVVAGAFDGTFDGAALSPGTHYLVVEQNATSVTVRQPLGADTDLSIVPPPGGTHAVALDADGNVIGPGAGVLSNGRFVLHYAAQLDGRAVAAYRIEG